MAEVNILSISDKDESKVSLAAAIAFSFSSEESSVGGMEEFSNSILSQFR